MKCLNCGFENPEEGKFCVNCGSKLEIPKCPECDNPLTPEMQFCGVCGATNPFFVGTKEKVKSEAVKEKKHKMSNKLREIIIFSAVLLIAVVSFAFSFGAISSTETYDWEYNNDSSEFEFLTISYNQNSIKMYKGYVDALTKDSELLVEIFEEEYSDLRDYYGDEMNASEYKSLYSKLDVYGLMVSSSHQEVTMLNTLEFLVEILLLISVQIMPLVIIGYVLIKFLKSEDPKGADKLLLVSGVFGILLGIALNNLYIVTSSGYGLNMYVVLMFGGYIGLKVFQIIENKSFTVKKTIIYTAKVTLGFILIAVISSSFIKIGYEYRENSFAYGAFASEDSKYLINVYDENFEFLPARDFFELHEYEFNDEDLSIRDSITLARIYNYTAFFDVELFENSNAQKITSVMIAFFSATAILLSIGGQMFNITDYEDNFSMIKVIINISLIVNIFVLIIFGIIYVSMFNDIIQRQDSLFNAKLGVGLVFAVIITTVFLVQDLFKSRNTETAL
jgi:hypothetical protein